MGSAALPASIGLQLAGSVYGASSAIQASRSQEGYYRYLAGQGDINARLAEVAGEVNARAIQDTAAADYGRHIRSVAKVRGAQSAAIAAAGIAGSVTAEDIARDTANTAKMDEMAIRFNADSKASEVLRHAGLTAFNLRSEAEGNRLAGSQALKAGRREALASLIGGATSVLSTIGLRPGATPKSPVEKPGIYSSKPFPEYRRGGTSYRPDIGRGRGVSLGYGY